MNAMYLSGSEAVERAGYRINSAADTISGAASSMETTAERLGMVMLEAVGRIEAAVPSSEDRPTLRDYFIAHAPAEPQPWFQPMMPSARPKRFEDDDAGWATNEAAIFLWDEERNKQRYIQWPAAWADEQLKERGR